MASHEFRTLLAQIDANAQRMISMRERLSATELAERAHRIRDAVRRMTQVIDDLSGCAELIDGHGNLHYREAEVDLTAVLREACELQRELTPDARIRETAESQPITVRGDATLLRPVFGNILSNAVKYSPKATWVDVSVARQEDEIAVVIEDHGIGIPEKECHRVFEHYYRASNTSGIPGSGVGLYVAKTLIDLHHGSIAVDSREGEGSRFEVRLPRNGPSSALGARYDVRETHAGEEAGEPDRGASRVA
jgi:two-component system, OmpR family, sensor kinase